MCGNEQNRINQMQFPPIDGVRNGKLSTSQTQEASATLHTYVIIVLFFSSDLISIRNRPHMLVFCYVYADAPLTTNLQQFLYTILSHIE